MKLNRKFIIGFSLILLIIWMGNIIYYKNHILKEPLFVKNYYELDKDKYDFTLSYIQDIKSNNKIEKIDFPEIKDNNVEFLELDQNNTDRRFYAFKTLEIKISNDKMKDYQNKIITNAVIKFSNGKVMKVNLGRIYFFSDRQIPNGLKLWNSQQGCYSFIVNKDTNIIGIESRFKKEVKDALKISINGKRISDKSFPIKLKKGDDFYMIYELNFSKDDTRRYNSYNLDFDIVTKDNDGNKESIPCFVGWGFPFYDNININYMKENNEVK